MSGNRQCYFGMHHTPLVGKYWFLKIHVQRSLLKKITNYFITYLEDFGECLYIERMDS